MLMDLRQPTAGIARPAWRGLALFLVPPMLPDAAVATEAVNLGHQSRWPGEIGITALILAIGSALAVYIYRTTARLRRHAAESKQTEDALRKSEERIRLLLNSTGEAIYGIDPQGNCTFANSACLKILGYANQNALLGKNMHRLIHHSYPDGRPMLVEACKIHQAFRKNQGTHIDNEMLWRADGSGFPAECWSLPQSVEGTVHGAVVTFVDITERRQREAYREMAREILQMLNAPGELREIIPRVLTALKTRTGFAAVGMRLRNGEDFPYFAQDGFSTDFLLTENTLTERGQDGGVCRDSNGQVCLECTCGLVLSGRTDPANPLFTRGGSCWTNDSLPLLDLPAAQDPRRHPRNECIHRGYASVALVPIRTKDQIVGLLQLNDRRKGCFSLAVIEQLEDIAAHLGEALMRKQAEAEKAELALQNQQLQKAESLGRMAGAIAHRLNNQLQVVMGNLELGMDDLPRNAEPFATLSIAMQAARHAAEVSQSMLTYLGQTSRQRTSLDLAQSCRQLLPVLTLNLPNGVALTTHLPDPGPIIAADAEQLQQVVTHLFTKCLGSQRRRRGDDPPDHQDRDAGGNSCRPSVPGRLATASRRLCLPGSGGCRRRHCARRSRKDFRPVLFPQIHWPRHGIGHYLGPGPRP